jgi:phage baseplate assembly protein gpV
MSFEQAEQSRLLANLVRVGKIVSVDAGSARAVVDFGGLISPPLPAGQLRAGALQFWWMPTVGEQVLVTCEGGDIAQGVIVVSIYAGNAPSADAAVPQINLAGGTMIVNGTLEVTGDVIASGVSLVHHTHKEVAAGLDNTGEPNR